MGLEERISCPTFNQNATERPQIDWVRPSNAQDDFGRSIVPCADHRAVILVIEGSAAEIDQVDLWAKQHSSELGRPRR